MTTNASSRPSRRPPRATASGAIGFSPIARDGCAFRPSMRSVRRSSTSGRRRPVSAWPWRWRKTLRPSMPRPRSRRSQTWGPMTPWAWRSRRCCRPLPTMSIVSWPWSGNSWGAANNGCRWCSRPGRPPPNRRARVSRGCFCVSPMRPWRAPAPCFRRRRWDRPARISQPSPVIRTGSRRIWAPTGWRPCDSGSASPGIS